MKNKDVNGREFNGFRVALSSLLCQAHRVFDAASAVAATGTAQTVKLRDGTTLATAALNMTYCHGASGTCGNVN